MDDYHQLKREIENPIHRGYLGKYIHGGATWPDVQNLGQQLALAEIDNRLTKKEVGMISQGAGHSSKRPREEKRVENIISFCSKDLVRVYNPIIILSLSAMIVKQ